VEGLTGRQTVLLGATGLAALVAGVLHYATEPGLPAFGAATLALAGLAWSVSFSTEQVGERFGPGATGVMQSTLGNLPEFFIVVFALADGQVVVAQTSIIGSIFANALLVLGLVILAGARQSDDGVMRFRQRLPTDTATLLLLAVFIIVLVGLSDASSDDASRHIKTISSIGAVLILGVYVLWLVPYVRSDEQAAAARSGGGSRVPLAVSIAMLGIAGTGAAFVSDWFVSALQPSIDKLDLSQAFAGIVIVAIAGNAVENVAGIVLAAKGQADLAISVVKNSVAQIAAFLFPALILVSLLFATPLTFALAPIYIGALALTAIAVWQITGDGEALAFEGWALIAFYLILATFAYFE
jgi:Ca2+:H+ antiporter